MLALKALLLLLPLTYQSSVDNLWDSTIDCTTSGPGNYTGCLPEAIKKYNIYFIVNNFAVLAMGTVTNLLTLLAVP